MLSKESKIRVLENFYALDYVFFGKPVKNVDMCCPLVKEEYLSVKGALMSVYVEMMKLVGHNPEALEERVDGKDLMQFARESAAMARENAQQIVSSPKARANIKGMLKEALADDPKADVTGLVERTIRTKAFSLAVDNLLIARSIKESKGFAKLNEWEGQIVEDSYKILRDNLVEAAHMILYDEDDVVTEAPIAYSASKIIAAARNYGGSVEKQAKAGCEKWSLKTPFKGTEYKKKMLACKAAAAIKGMNAEASYIKKGASSCKDDKCKAQLKDRLQEIAAEIKEEKYYLSDKVSEKLNFDREWITAIYEDAKDIAANDSIGSEMLDEALTDREKTFLFGRIQRMFGDCAKKCGRITILSKANSCKDMCIAKKDQAIKAARAKAKADKAAAKGNTAKAAKMNQKAKDIKSY